MDKIFYFISTLLIVVMVWLLQEEFQGWDQQRQLLKAANNEGVHSAVQTVGEINEGTLTFSPVNTLEAYNQTLQANLGLDESFAPRTGSPVRSDIRLIYFETIDDTHYDFPFLYTNEEYHITKYLRGPAVVAVIEMDYPMLLQRSFDIDPIRVPAIYEYVRSET